MGESNNRGGWNKVGRRIVEKVWKDIGGNQEKILSIEKFAGHKTEAKEMIERRERLVSARKQGEGGRTLRHIGGG